MYKKYYRFTVPYTFQKKIVKIIYTVVKIMPFQLQSSSKIFSINIVFFSDSSFLNFPCLSDCTILKLDKKKYLYNSNK